MMAWHRRLVRCCLVLAHLAVPAALSAGAAEPASQRPVRQDRSAQLCFLHRLPPPLSGHIADDVKLLVGWTFDAAVSGTQLRAGDLVTARSGFKDVPGFAGPTPLDDLQGRYRVLRASFDDGHGYYGVAVGALDDKGDVAAVLLLNRLFRMPVILQQPLGLATDFVTGGAMLVGARTAAIRDAETAADAAEREAEARDVPLIIAGQSLAGGFAQEQVAHLQHLQKDAVGNVLVGFLTMNAADALPLIRRSGVAGEDVAGINFSKDLDPGFGPHVLLANRVGKQVYVHPDGTAGSVPGDTGLLSALLHPKEHFLSSFNSVSLSAAMLPVLEDSAQRCR